MGARKGVMSAQGEWIQHILTGFPDRVAQRRSPGTSRFLMANGQGARLAESSVVRQAEYIIALTLKGARRGQRQEHQITLAHGIEASALKTQTTPSSFWDSDRGRARAVLRETYGQLVVKEMEHTDLNLPTDEAARLLANAVCSDPIGHLAAAKAKAVEQYLARVTWLKSVRPELELPSFGWLLPAQSPAIELIEFCLGCFSLAEYRALELTGYLKGQLGYTQCQRIDELAPERLSLPDGSSKSLRYEGEQVPVLATRFERLFGLKHTPQIAGVNLMLELLAPNMRPIQTTRDLGSFWENTYPLVRKELRGRYPKHPWPEDPFTCPPGIHRRRKG